MLNTDTVDELKSTEIGTGAEVARFETHFIGLKGSSPPRMQKCWIQLLVFRRSLLAPILDNRFLRIQDTFELFL